MVALILMILVPLYLSLVHMVRDQDSDRLPPQMQDSKIWFSNKLMQNFQISDRPTFPKDKFKLQVEDPVANLKVK